MSENVMCSDHKATNETYRKEFDRIFRGKRDIFDEILSKVHEFIEHHGKYPSWICLNPDHYHAIKPAFNFWAFAEMDWGTGQPGTIMGMQYLIKADLMEIEVQ